MSAYDELIEALQPGEQVEAVLFGHWDDSDWDESPVEPGGVPREMRGVLLTLEQARPLMQSWNIRGGYGCAECYALNVWTDRRVLFITQYDGATTLDYVPRNPTACIPAIFGGG
jgi:hypothetical protein